MVLRAGMDGDHNSCCMAAIICGRCGDDFLERFPFESKMENRLATAIDTDVVCDPLADGTRFSFSAV